MVTGSGDAGAARVVVGGRPDMQARPARSDAVAEAWQRMRGLTHHPDVLRRAHDVAEEAGLTPGVTKALSHLSADHPVPMRELAGALRCDNSYVTAVVDGLEDRGMARRQPHPTDRRIKVIELTDRGAQVAARVRAVLDDPPAAFDRLTDDEAAQLASLLRKLTMEPGSPS